MSVILADHPNSAPYRYDDVYGNKYEYKDITAEQASDWNEAEQL